jgi:hypothetical protein
MNDDVEFEIYVKYLVQMYCSKGSKSWTDYERAKKACIAYFNPTEERYQVMIKIITDWLEL